MKIKLTRCHLCNATKVRPSPTAYVYCDYCGALTDFDFQLAISDKRSKLPGPEYERLNKALAPRLAAALEQKDQEAYLSLQRELYEAYVEACPASCAPRVADPVYRQKYVEQCARGAAAGAFDAQLAAASARQGAAMKALKWIPGGAMGVTCEPRSFWALYETVLEMQMVSKEMSARAGLTAFLADGDNPTNEKIALSMFVQGWLPYLKPAEVDELMKRTGLGGQYVELVPFAGQSVPCGCCKADVPRLEGAKQAVCDSCGRLLRTDVVVPCSQCAASLLMPAEQTTFKCPFCETELRTMAWTADQLTR